MGAFQDRKGKQAWKEQLDPVVARCAQWRTVWQLPCPGRWLCLSEKECLQYLECPRFFVILRPDPISLRIPFHCY